MKLISLLTLFLVFQIFEACRNDGKTFRNGEEWTQNNAFVMRCEIQDNGAWSTKAIACLTPSKTRIPVGSSLNEGNDQWRCEANDRGMIGLIQGANTNAKCDGHSVGERWVENTFEFECHPGGNRRVAGCVADGFIKIPVNATKEVFGRKRSCMQHRNGTIVFE